MNLDLECARRAYGLLYDQTSIDFKVLENLVTKTLGVLQENGIYALFLFLYSQKENSYI